MSTAVTVVVVIAALLAAQLMLTLVWFPRRRRVVARRLKAELAAETVIRAPEPGSYQGATATGYPTTTNEGMIALTCGRLVFRTLTGTRIDIPVADVIGVCRAAVADEGTTAGRQHLIIQTSAGEIGFGVDDNAAWIASLSAAAGVSTSGSSGRPSSASSDLLRSRRNVTAVLAKVFAAVGLTAVLATGISAAVVAESISDKSRHAEGTIVDFARSGKGYDPVVEYAPPGGAPIRFNGWLASTTSAYRIGEHVPVRYDPDNPQNAVIDTYWQVWFVPTLFGMIATPFVVTGTSYGLVALSTRRRITRRRLALESSSETSE